MGMMDWLFGTSAPEYKPGQFGPSRPFPTQDDLAQARNADEFRYSPETTANTYQVSNAELPDDATALGIRDMAEAGKLQPVTDQGLIDTLARNKLAAHRSAIASLGIDNLDNVVGATDFGFDKFYGKTAKQEGHPLYTFVGSQRKQTVPSTPIHEAIHRGLFKLRDAIEGMPNSPETSELRNFIDNPTDNEFAVRQLMQQLYDDPERDRMPEDIQFFLDNDYASYTRDRVSRMNALAETLAQKLVQQRKPGGPW